MGDLFTWSIFACILGACVGIVLYSLLGRYRSILIAIPTFFVMVLSLFAAITSPRSLQAITLLMFIGAIAGIVRQFRDPDAAKKQQSD